MTIQQRAHVIDAIKALQTYDTLMRQYSEVLEFHAQLRTKSPEALIRCAQMASDGIKGAELRIALQEAKKLERTLQVYTDRLTDLGKACETARQFALAITHTL